MQKSFDGLVNSFIENQVGIAHHFLSVALAANLKQNLLTLHDEQQLYDASIGHDAHRTKQLLTRSDKICWLDPKHNNTHENAFFAIINAFVLYLNQTCFTGIQSYEFHYALYEKGSFYKKHVDQFRDNKSRAYSMIIYLNTEWLPEDGGELCIHHADHLQVIPPTSGKCVFFRSSDLEHEVLITRQPRMSITGWLKV